METKMKMVNRRAAGSRHTSAKACRKGGLAVVRVPISLGAAGAVSTPQTARVATVKAIAQIVDVTAMSRVFENGSRKLPARGAEIAKPRIIIIQTAGPNREPRHQPPAGVDGVDVARDARDEATHRRLVEEAEPARVQEAEDVQAQVGHAHASTTSLYTHVSADFKHKTVQRMIARRIGAGVLPGGPAGAGSPDA